MNLPTSTWRSAWRQLRAEPGPAALVIAGLALGLALTLLTASFLQDVLWPDAGLPERDRLVTLEFQARGPGGIRTDWFGAVLGFMQSGSPPHLIKVTSSLVADSG